MTSPSHLSEALSKQAPRTRLPDSGIPTTRISNPRIVGRANTAPLMILLFVGVIGAGGFLFWRLQEKEESENLPPVVEKVAYDPATKTAKFREEAIAAMSAYRAVKRSEDVEEKKAAWDEALAKNAAWRDAWDEATVPIKDDEGRYKPRFSGYSEIDQEIQTMRMDLVKDSSF